jgi:phosphoglycerate dehydrogenase-like enzyme
MKVAAMKIAVLDDYQGAAQTYADWSAIERVHSVTVFRTPFQSQAAVVAALQPYDVLCIMRERTRLDAETIAALPNLKCIVTTGFRNAAIDLAATKARGIVVTGTAVPANATVELTFALMLGQARHIPAETANMAGGRWQTTVGRELKGRTLGVIGLGRLGAQVATIAQAFGMSVIAWSENLTDERAQAAGARRVDKDTLFRTADIITLHMVLSQRSRGLIGARELALMKPDATLINTSRGPIVDVGAVVAALEAGTLGGYAADVYDEEPLPADHPLRRAPRTTLTPHVGYVTEETFRVFYPETVESLTAWIEGNPVRLIT